MKRFYLSILPGVVAAIALVTGALLAPVVAGDDLNVVEGDTLTFEVRLPPQQGGPPGWGLCSVSYDFSTENGTALSGQDYRQKSGRLEYLSEDAKSIEVEVHSDNCTEPDETLSLVVNNREYKVLNGSVTLSICESAFGHLWREKTFHAAIEDDGTGQYEVDSYEARKYGCSGSSSSTFGE